ncbi:MAG: alpha/beta hydrolase [Sandaracinaceae bacterium]|nr:alpha/beta hydrolase [Sandaracinaceae bacterium]
MAGARSGKREWSQGSRRALFVAGLLLGIPLLAFAVFTLLAPPSVVGASFAGLLLLWSFGALTAPWRNIPYVCTAALAGMLLVIGYRYLEGESGERLTETSEPGGGPARALDRILPERDVALGGSRILALAGAVPDDAPGLLSALRDGYSRMSDAEGAVPSPVLGTFVQGQSASDYTVVRVGTGSFNPPSVAVVFLHGFIGSVALLCWQVSLAAQAIGAVTVCPSTDWQAQWTSPDSLVIVERTLSELRSQGVRRIYLAGLSAGAIGVSRIAHRFDVEGVILLSGASSRVEHPKRVPTLVIQGGRDPRTPAGPARAYARRLGALASYREVPEADHWLVLSHHEQVRRWMEEWLTALEGMPSVEPPTGAP